jgi:hypothetical protein
MTGFPVSLVLVKRIILNTSDVTHLPPPFFAISYLLLKQNCLTG